MKHEAIPASPAEAPDIGSAALQRTIARSLARVMMLGLTVAIATIGAGTVAVADFAAITFDRKQVVLAGGTLAAGVAVLLLLAWWVSKAVARVAAQPVDLLLSQLEDGATREYHWEAARALGPRQIESDLGLLQRRTRQATRRTRQMIADLERAREQASRQNLAKSQFLANMSHELRTPLNAVLGYAMLLYEDAAEARNASAMADLDRIQQAGRNLLGIINEILDLAKIETGRATLSRNVIDVEAMVRTVAGSYEAAAGRSGNRFDFRVAPGAEMMIGDQAKIVQCLNSLLSNACKFTRDGQIDLDVALVEGANGKCIRFKVSDTGIGIDAAHLDGLFEAFEQADKSATRQHGGAGLGLAIVRRLAEMMGGNCSVQSRPGEGSTFSLTLVVGEPRESLLSSRAERSAEASSEYAETPHAEHTALVVDDDEATIELIRRWLTRMGYNVLSTTDGEVGLALARQHQPDLILLDAVLPGRSGYELMADLRADESIAHIPAILVTVDDDRRRGLHAGATDYIRKPVSENQLRELLDVYRGQVAGDVLVIEDDDDAADLVARCVAQVGFSSRRALDGADGLEMAAQKRPDAIVLDLAMPAMNGFEVIDRLAADKSLSSVPLIVVSGAEITLEQHRKLASAGHRFLPKAASTPRQIAESLKRLVA